MILKRLLYKRNYFLTIENCNSVLALDFCVQRYQNGLQPVHLD